MVGKVDRIPTVVFVEAWANVSVSEFTVTVPAQSMPDKVIRSLKGTVGLVPVRTSVAADAPLKRVQLAWDTL